MAIPSKPRKCRVCKEAYQPARPLQTVCSPACAIEQAHAARAKAERIAGIEDRKTIRIKLDKLKTLSKWLREAQSAFNGFIRERDKDQPCISCGRFHQGAHDAGHYRSVGAAGPLRFDEQNVHRQCVPCNQHKSGNVLEYRIGLIKRIGQAAVDRLEGPLPETKWTIEQAKAIKAEYIAKRRAFSK